MEPSRGKGEGLKLKELSISKQVLSDSYGGGEGG